MDVNQEEIIMIFYLKLKEKNTIGVNKEKIMIFIPLSIKPITILCKSNEMKDNFKASQTYTLYQNNRNKIDIIILYKRVYNLKEID
jgi:hypothetical protein